MRCNFLGDADKKEELFRNTLVNQCKLIEADQLDQVEFYFKTQPDPQTGEQIDLTFTRADFVEIEGDAAESLIKTAVNKELNKLSDL